MEIWIIRDGEKAGPFHDFDVRRRILDRELHADTPAWHEGLPAWRPLGEIELFKGEFIKEIEPEPPPLPPREPAPRRPAGQSMPPPPPPLHLARRFWARWCDLILYSGLWWFGIWAAGQNVEAALLNPWIQFFRYLPWFIFEALLIHYWGTTPGKWLLGIRVLNADGSRLTLQESIRRALRVLFTGIGFGYGLLSIFCQGLSFFVSRRLGTTLWDHAGGHRLHASPLRPARLALHAMLLAGAMFLQYLVLAPFYWKYAAADNPEAAEFLNDHPPWHLPVRE